MNKCTCGSSTSQHSIFCSGNHYNDPLKDTTYKPKSDKEVLCEVCQCIKSKSQFINLSKVCIDCD